MGRRGSSALLLVGLVVIASVAVVSSGLIPGSGGSSSQQPQDGIEQSDSSTQETEEDRQEEQAGSPQPPEASISYTPPYPSTTHPVSVSAEGSQDDGRIESYEWDWDGDGDFNSEGIEDSHTYTSTGTRTLRLRVTDNHGSTDTATETVDVVRGSADNLIRTKVYVNESAGVSRSDYRSFLDRVEEYFDSEGVTVTITIEDWVEFPSTGEGCVSRARFDRNDNQDLDLALCVGRGEGGFYGSRINVLGHNTKQFDTLDDVHTTAHEFIHYLGFQDTYGYPPEMPKKWIKSENDIMSASVWSDDPHITDITREMIAFNLDQLSEGRKALYYRREPDDPGPPEFRNHRMPDGTTVSIGFPGHSSCTVSEILRDDTRVLGTYSTDSQDRIEFDMDEFSQNRGINATCSGNTYWVPFFRLDRCFIENGYTPPDTCRLSCDGKEGDWCVFEGVE